MTNRLKLFDEQWLERARKSTDSDDTSWARDVLATLDTTGGSYLSLLRVWYDRFPLTPKAKQHLRSRLECFLDDQHLGGVNEMAWWEFMRREGLKGKPLSSSSKPLPDFELEPPTDCFVEVSTLNVSKADLAEFGAKKSLALKRAQTETIRRIAGKLTGEKLRQLRHAAEQARPCVLALFDYTTWSGYDTQFFRALGAYLLGTEFGFKSLPSEVSALVYLERKVMDGRIALSCDRSAIYYNPLALHIVPTGTFSSLNQFSSQLVLAEPKFTDHWLWL